MVVWCCVEVEKARLHIDGIISDCLPALVQEINHEKISRASIVKEHHRLSMT